MSTWCGELSYLKTKTRDHIWRAFDGLYQEALFSVQCAHGLDRETIMGDPMYSDAILENFYEKIKCANVGQMHDYIEVHMEALKNFIPGIVEFPQEIAWAYIRSKYTAKNNLLGFREREHIVSFRAWYHNTFNIITSRLLDNPSLFEIYIPRELKIRNILESKQYIDQAIEDGIYAAIDWHRVFSTKPGPVALPPSTPLGSTAPPAHHGMAGAAVSSHAHTHSPAPAPAAMVAPSTPSTPPPPPPPLRAQQVPQQTQQQQLLQIEAIKDKIRREYETQHSNTLKINEEKLSEYKAGFLKALSSRDSEVSRLREELQRTKTQLEQKSSMSEVKSFFDSVSSAPPVFTHQFTAPPLPSTPVPSVPSTSSSSSFTPSTASASSSHYPSYASAGILRGTKMPASSGASSSSSGMSSHAMQGKTHSSPPSRSPSVTTTLIAPAPAPTPTPSAPSVPVPSEQVEVSTVEAGSSLTDEYAAIRDSQGYERSSASHSSSSSSSSPLLSKEEAANDGGGASSSSSATKE